MRTEDMIEAFTRLKGVIPPEAGETQEEFYGRCMADPGMRSEYPDDDQRSAMCTARWQEPANPSGVDDSKATGKEIDWGSIGVTPEQLLQQIQRQLNDGFKEAIKEIAQAEVHAAHCRLTGRID